MNLENIKILKKGKIDTEGRADYILNNLMIQMNNIQIYLKKSILDDDKSEYYILMDMKDIEVLMKIDNCYIAAINIDYKKSIYERMKIFGLQVCVVMDFNKDPIIVKYQK